MEPDIIREMNDPRKTTNTKRPGIFRILDSRRRMIRAYRRGIDAPDYPPLFLWIESTNRCNLRCPMCPQSDGLKRERGAMSMALVEKIAAEAEGRVQLMSLHFGGEPLLHKQLPDIVETLSKRGIVTLLHTNGTLAGAEQARALTRAGLDHIVFSFDAIPRGDYENKRTPATFEKTHAAIREFLEEKKRLRSRWPFVTMKALVFHGQAEPAAALVELRSLFKGLPVDHFAVEFAHSFSGTFAGKVADEKRYALPPRAAGGRCVLPWYGFAIGWDGAAYACCNDLDGEFSLGNINETSLMDIWNGPEARRLRRHLADGNMRDLPLCARCESGTRGFSSKDAWMENVKFSVKYALRPALFPRRA